MARYHAATVSIPRSEFWPLTLSYSRSQDSACRRFNSTLGILAFDTPARALLESAKKTFQFHARNSGL